MASLIYHAGALGDFITALPAMGRWREQHSGERMILLGRPAHAAIAPPFDEVWDADSTIFASLFSESAPFETLAAERLRLVTSALLFAAPSSQLPASLEHLGVTDLLRQDPFPSSVAHVIDYHLSLFPATDDPTSTVPRIRIPDLATGDDIGGTAAIHTGSGSVRKNWPLDRFMELATLLVRGGAKISWIVGPADAGVGPVQDGATWKSLSLPVLAARLASCRLYVGNDSGVTHLAAATGCSTVALFGESDPRVWAPRGARVKVIDSNGGGMEAIRVEDVFRACVDFLNDE